MTGLASPERHLERELAGRGEPRRDRNSAKPERVSTAWIGSAVTRGTAPKASRPYERSVRIGHILRTPIRVGEEAYRRAEVGLELTTATRDLPLGFRAGL